ncbi:hypothetical protein ACH4N4_30620 [Streptomyces microflavus]|uniref:hypothetical protein n=1 Tax=Streptomyces microflavus TaxID=1919 RepID=UPI0037B6DB02
MTTQPERLPTDVVEARLNHLIDRARRNRLLHEEADRFTTELRDLVRRMEDTEDERDRLATEAKILRARVNDQNAAADVAVSAVRLMNEAGAQRDRAEARVRELEAEVHRYEEVVVGDLNEANIGLQREVARLTAGQCLDSRAMCEKHHLPPVAGCPYPRCRAARGDQPTPAPRTPGVIDLPDISNA